MKLSNLENRINNKEDIKEKELKLKAQKNEILGKSI
jgi:hypothetical protein